MSQPTLRISPDYPGFGGGSTKRKRKTKPTKKPAAEDQSKIGPVYEEAMPLPVPDVVALPPFRLVNDPAQLMSRRDIQAITRYSKTTFFKYSRFSGFPAPIRFSSKTVRYRRAEFEAWLESQEKPLDSRN